MLSDFIQSVSWSSSVSIVSDYRLDDRGSILGRDKGFFYSSLCVQTGSGARPASSPMGTGGSFSGDKAQPWRDTNHSPPSSAEFSFPLGACMAVAVHIYLQSLISDAAGEQTREVGSALSTD
jgi:hypothetical protein